MPEFGDAGSGGGVVHGAVLECGVVAVDRCLGVVDLGGDGVEFSLPVGVGVAEFLAGGGDDLLEDAGLLVEVIERLQHGDVGGVRGEAGAGAAGGAVAAAGVAGVVPVAGVAASYGGADVLVAAVGAGD
ncbi:hypothetical protein AB0M54_15875 [Actinoplanes sp. NPDC051470]|uniref:hypothetical protein n=1 Tax=Actinoplanes sp. NPDC051470 TaxID=3157224 RepID=UPI003426836E